MGGYRFSTSYARCFSVGDFDVLTLIAPLTTFVPLQLRPHPPPSSGSVDGCQIWFEKKRTLWGTQDVYSMSRHYDSERIL
jgi:hypothetical protein